MPACFIRSWTTTFARTLQEGGKLSGQALADGTVSAFTAA
jgi:hypothetical protein